MGIYFCIFLISLYNLQDLFCHAAFLFVNVNLQGINFYEKDPSFLSQNWCRTLAKQMESGLKSINFLLEL